MKIIIKKGEEKYFIINTSETKKIINIYACKLIIIIKE